MKPFGVRLAAGAVTILLGAIMAAQAQKDHQDDLQTSWNPLQHVDQKSAGDAPAPIGLMPLGSDAASSQSSQPWTQNPAAQTHSEPSPFADVPDAVQLVQHTEGLADDAAAAVANGVQQVAGTLAMPSTFSTPAESASETPAVAMTFPGEAPSMESNVAESLNLPPTMPAMPNPHAIDPEFANAPATDSGQPSNFLRGVGDDAAAAPAEHAMATPNNFMGGFGGEHAPHNSAQHNPAQHNNAMAADGPATQMLRGVSMPGDQRDLDDRAALESQQRAIAQEEMQRQELALQQEARAIEMERQRRAEQMLAEERFQQEQLAREQDLQLERERELQRQAQQNVAPALPRGQNGNPQYDQTQNSLAQYNGRDANAPNQNRQANDRGFGGGLQALPVAHKLNGQSSGTFAKPGERRLEGAQAPSVVIHKRAPGEVKVGKPASFVIHVQNVGSAEALNVRVFDQVPAGMKFKDATPQAQSGGQGDLVWQLGTLAAGEERTVTMELIPVEEGELGSVARVTFEAAASVRTMSTRPELKIVQKAPKTVLVGQQLEIEVEVSNPGTGDATGVMLQEDVPEILEHPRGRELDNLIGTLRPGEVRRQMLRLRAVSPGMVRNTIFLRGDDGLEASHSVDVQVVSPQLQVALTGPGRRFLERQAVYSLDIANAGTAPATNVRITAFLDRGFKFVGTGNAGQYDSSRHAVYWQLDDLPVGARGQVPLTLLPVQEGARSIQLEAKADLGVVAKNEHRVDVESLAELTFSVADSADPIEVGTETIYEIKVANQGSRPDSNVQVQVQLPPGIELIDAEDAQSNGRGLVVFRPRPQLGANAELVYRIKARGVRDGRHKIEAIVKSDQSAVPVTKEESTMVYDDRQPAVARGQSFQR